MEFETARLMVRRFGIADAAFMHSVLNDPGFLANIGDRRVRTIADAETYLRERTFASYDEHGFGTLVVTDKASGVAVGTVGFVRREGLDGPDLGFAFLEGHVGKGYGYEAATGLLGSRPDLRPLLAITAPENHASAGLLGKLGFVETGRITLPSHGGESRLFLLDR